MSVPKPVARFTVVTLGVSDIRRSIAFYDSLLPESFETGEQVAFFDTGATVLALYPWDKLAADAASSVQPQPAGFRGITLAWNCRSDGEVDEVLKFAVGQGATLQKAAHHTSYGGYSGYFTDPDGYLMEVVVAPGIEVGDDRRVHLQE
jgi:catechol 2,3-dioxygenase-like lactoylglutathione lyase family enzyme